MPPHDWTVQGLEGHVRGGVVVIDAQLVPQRGLYPGDGSKPEPWRATDQFYIRGEIDVDRDGVTDFGFFEPDRHSSDFPPNQPTMTLENWMTYEYVGVVTFARMDHKMELGIPLASLESDEDST